MKDKHKRMWTRLARKSTWPRDRVSALQKALAQAGITPRSEGNRQRAGEGDGMNEARLCVICGARVVNMNPKTVTCSPPCTIAKEYGLTRQQAINLFGYSSERQPKRRGMRKDGSRVERGAGG